MNGDILWQPGQTLEQVERAVIAKAYRFFEFNKTRTAASLDISIRTLDAKLEAIEEEKKARANNVQIAAAHIRPASSAGGGEAGNPGPEPTAENPGGNPLSMPERSDVQRMPQRQVAQSGPRKHR